MKDPKLEMIKGTLDVLILKSLSWGPMHGYAVSRWIRQITDNELQIEEGALYPALHIIGGLLRSTMPHVRHLDIHVKSL